MLNSVLVFVAIIVVVGVSGFLLHESLPGLIHCYRMRTSAVVVSQLTKVERPLWATTGRTQVNVYTSSDGVAGCTVTSSFSGEERFEHSSISYCPRG